MRSFRSQGDLVILRSLEERDLPLTMQWRNDERSLRWFMSDRPLEWLPHVAWFTRYMASDSRDCMFFAETNEGVPVGQSSVYNFSSDGRRAEVGRFLSDPDLRGRGFFREALLLTLDAAFGPLALDEVFLEVLADNARAIRLYESVGFESTHRTEGDRPVVAMVLPCAKYQKSTGRSVLGES